MDRKGLISLGQVSAVVMILIVVGIMLVVGTRVESNLRDDMDTTTISHTLTNVTTRYTTSGYSGNASLNLPGNYTFLAGTSYILAKGRCSLALTEVANTSAATGHATVLAAGNYTVSGCGIYFSSSSAGDATDYNNTRWNLTGTITWNSDTTEYNASDDTIEGMSNVSENQGLLGTIIIFGIILGVVVALYQLRGGR